MIEEFELKNDLQLVDFGDARIETRQISPIPPIWIDYLFGYGADRDAK